MVGNRLGAHDPSHMLLPIAAPTSTIPRPPAPRRAPVPPAPCQPEPRPAAGTSKPPRTWGREAG